MYYTNNDLNELFTRLENLINTMTAELEKSKSVKSNDDLLHINVVSKILKTERSTLYKWMKYGVLNYKEYNGKRYVDKDYLDNILHYIKKIFPYGGKLTINIMREIKFSMIYNKE